MTSAARLDAAGRRLPWSFVGVRDLNAEMIENLPYGPA